jgi:hypothetical protein
MKAPTLSPASAMILQVLVVLVGLGTLALLLIEPHFEGRNVGATAFEVYFKDPFLAYVYVGSIPFFVALARAFQLLAEVRRVRVFSASSVAALRAIKRCALALLAFVAGAALMILFFGDGEDRPPGVVMCALAVLGATAMAVTAAKLGRALETALARA